MDRDNRRMKHIKTYKIFESYSEVKSIIKDFMNDIEDEYGFECIYHDGKTGWGYPCDLALVFPMQSNYIHRHRHTVDTEEYYMQKLSPPVSIGLEKIKYKYDIIYNYIVNNMYYDSLDIKVVGMRIGFRENQRAFTFTSTDFLSFEDFEKDVKEGKYFKLIEVHNLNHPKIEEMDNLVILFKKID